MKKRISFWDKVKNKFRIGVLDTDTKVVKVTKGEIPLDKIDNPIIFKNPQHQND